MYRVNALSLFRKTHVFFSNGTAKENGKAFMVEPVRQHHDDRSDAGVVEQLVMMHSVGHFLSRRTSRKKKRRFFFLKSKKINENFRMMDFRWVPFWKKCL